VLGTLAPPELALSLMRSPSLRHLVLLLPLLSSVGFAADIPPHLGRADTPYYTDHRQADFPFQETTLDVRGTAPLGNTNNLAPRALVIQVTPDVFVGFDTELLRVVAMWTGDSISPLSMSQLSYGVPLEKLGGGIDRLPRPQGQVFAATGLYPGWQPADTKSFVDPRPRGLDPEELGRGPLPRDQGRWLGVQDQGDHALISYTVGKATVHEIFSLLSGDQTGVQRSLSISNSNETMSLVVAELDQPATTVPTHFSALGAKLSLFDERFVIATIQPRADAGWITIFYGKDPNQKPDTQLSEPRIPHPENPNRSTDEAVTRMVSGQLQGSYAVDELLIPYPNPWQRRIRPIDIDFAPSGIAFMVTFDGDVYRIEGLDSLDENRVSLRRIATGFHDPQSIQLRGNDVFVLSRMGLTRLVDQDNDGDTDFYEMFSNEWLQSPETRAFPLSLVLMRDDSFLISLGGQQDAHPTPYAGRVIQIAADGKFQRIFADGLRNGYVSRLGDTDRLVASDQQGNWVPTTPMHHIEEGKFYGYEPGTTHSRPPAPVPVWIPHRYAQSGIDILAIDDPRSGNLFGSVLMADFYKPTLVKILGALDETLTQAVAMPLPIDFEVPFLKGEMNPADGQPYFVGMQVWGSNAARIEGISRLRAVTPTDDLPTQASAHAEGIWLQLGEPLPAETALDPASYTATAWQYHRTEAYGSGQYRSNGDPGVDQWPIHSVYLSADRTALFLAIPNMAPAQQLEVQYRRQNGDWQKCFFTIYELPPATPQQKSRVGISDFAAIFAAPPSPRSAPLAPPAVSVDRGQELYHTIGCAGCHSVDGSTEGKSGPSLLGIYQTRRPLANGRSRTANANYLRDSLMEPEKNITLGYEKQDVAMPSYRGVLQSNDVDSLIMLIESLRRDHDEK